MTREKIREMTMQLIYQMDAEGNFDYTEITPMEEDAAAMNKKQALAVLEAVRSNISDIDLMISENLDKWDFSRVAKTDLAILRTAVAEMMYVDSIPAGVSINEAVNLAKKYGDERSYAFVNSVLTKVSKKIGE